MKTEIELAKQAGWEYADDDRGFEPLWRFAELVRADAIAKERAELVESIDWIALMRQGQLVTWGDAEELGDRVVAAIQARGEASIRSNT